MKIDDIETAYLLKSDLDDAIQKRKMLDEYPQMEYAEMRLCAFCFSKSESTLHIERFSKEFSEAIRNAFIAEYDRYIAQLNKNLEELL